MHIESHRPSKDDNFEYTSKLDTNAFLPELFIPIILNSESSGIKIGEKIVCRIDGDVIVSNPCKM